MFVENEKKMIKHGTIKRSFSINENQSNYLTFFMNICVDLLLERVLARFHCFRCFRKHVKQGRPLGHSS